mmetsp:Transcript_14538/g.18328  ORF Transcript_14538/g.18328 Transcript_14538/m.18328 type:complete len:80 (+) Transcript_14538:665-904(+)
MPNSNLSKSYSTLSKRQGNTLRLMPKNSPLIHNALKRLPLRIKKRNGTARDDERESSPRWLGILDKTVKEALRAVRLSS